MKKKHTIESLKILEKRTKQQMDHIALVLKYHPTLNCVPKKHTDIL